MIPFSQWLRVGTEEVAIPSPCELLECDMLHLGRVSVGGCWPTGTWCYSFGEEGLL